MDNRKKQPVIGISFERCIYNSKEINKFGTYLTAPEEKLYKKRITRIIKLIQKKPKRLKKK